MAVASRFPFNFIVEFNFPLMIPAIGASFSTGLIG
jgi:hypothetical protein